MRFLDKQMLNDEQDFPVEFSAIQKKAQETLSRLHNPETPIESISEVIKTVKVDKNDPMVRKIVSIRMANSCKYNCHCKK